ncbi:MAG: N-acetylmuramoyl-L-alanine amidase [Paludibacteraceae bacterium]|nr:N-acetylmuramoyl-L-alanine amidase [Paludibacteraceae bacterium]
MHIRASFKYISIILLLLYLSAQDSSGQKILENQISDSLTAIARKHASVGRVKVNSINVNNRNKTLLITASDRLAEIPMRPENVEQIYKMLEHVTKEKYPGYKIECISDKTAIEELIPNFYSHSPLSKNRVFNPKSTTTALVSNISRVFQISQGLQNRHIAVWQSHGWHYNQEKKRWMWQRSRLFQTVEDLYTQAYVLSFLTPMLENAGANVHIPRERDTQKHEKIIDNDDDILVEGRYREHNDRKTWRTAKPGFANSKEFYLQGENPFMEGTYRKTNTITDAEETSSAEWIPEIPEEGHYAVYVSYKSLDKSTADARYSVFHKGGRTDFTVNQTMNGGTWVYLGHFKFPKGRHSDYRVELSNLSTTADRIITADAVKFGGGKGNIARSPLLTNGNAKNGNAQKTLSTDSIKPTISGYPRFTEAARYWLQWAGVPDSIYSRTEGANDYSDDFQSRGFWLNWLAGGSSVLPDREGQKVPVDLALAFHTDAGVVKNDSIIGTLGIYSLINGKGLKVFENGVSRMASRELTDLIQTQITEDIRATFAPEWTRRGLWNKSYSESRVPEIPTMLLELLSHQNPHDMQYGHDPRFRFTVSRAIYKAILKYISFNSSQPYVVQPLPPEQFCTRFIGRNKVVLTWEAVNDPLELTAKPTGYVVYTRKGDNDFDNGRYTNTNNFSIDIETGKIYSFKVTAVNEGGESFATETLSVYRAPNNNKEVLIVNGFERVSGPAFVSHNESSSGFDHDSDPGVPYMYDISFTGKQYEFDRKKPWKTDDDPGFGASYGNMETQVIAGNTFDYPFTHGKALKDVGYSYVSTSVKALINSKINLNEFRYVNIILGKQKQTITGNSKKEPEFKTFPLALQQIISVYCRAGGNLLISGAFVGSDFQQQNYLKPEENLFMENILKFRYNSSCVNFSSKVKMVSTPFSHFQRSEFSLYDSPGKEMYHVESTDCIDPAGNGAFSFCRYTGTNMSAGIIFRGNYRLCILGFPFESIKSEKERNKLMGSVMSFFSNQKINPNNKTESDTKNDNSYDNIQLNTQNNESKIVSHSDTDHHTEFVY